MGTKGIRILDFRLPGLFLVQILGQLKKWALNGLTGEMINLPTKCLGRKLPMLGKLRHAKLLQTQSTLMLPNHLRDFLVNKALIWQLTILLSGLPKLESIQMLVIKEIIGKETHGIAHRT